MLQLRGTVFSLAQGWETQRRQRFYQILRHNLQGPLQLCKTLPNYGESQIQAWTFKESLGFDLPLFPGSNNGGPGRGITEFSESIGMGGACSGVQGKRPPARIKCTMYSNWKHCAQPLAWLFLARHTPLPHVDWPRLRNPDLARQNSGFLFSIQIV